jgi:4-hydroxybenzoate polyprenyltransferase
MASKILSLVRSSHPGPSLAVTAVAAILGLSVGLEPWRLLILTLTVATNQLSIGLSNDWIDSARDIATARADKPVALGLVNARTVRNAALVSLTFSLGFSLLLNPLALAANGVFLLSGWLYNLGLKKTPFSVFPYIAGFGCLPALVTLAQPQPVFAAWWAIITGALLGVAAHFANVLPDLDDDRATGVRGLPHILGAKPTGVITGIALATGALVVVWGPNRDPELIQLIGGGASVVLALACVLITLRRPSSQPPTRLLFRLIILAAFMNVALIAFTGDQLQSL